MARFPADVTIEYPEKLSRGVAVLKLLLGWAYVGIPHGIVLALYEIAVAVVVFISFWVVLFTGKYPRGMFDFVQGYMRWSLRVSAYLYFMRDEYPPFTNES
jgi:hypothetical protein